MYSMNKTLTFVVVLLAIIVVTTATTVKQCQGNTLIILVSLDMLYVHRRALVYSQCVDHV